MSPYVELFRQLEMALAREQEPFWLFALALSDDQPGRWDLLVASPWTQRDREASAHVLSERVRDAFPPGEPAALSRIVVLDRLHPMLAALCTVVQMEHGSMEIKDSNFMGVEIRHTFVITARRPPPAVAVTLYTN